MRSPASYRTGSPLIKEQDREAILDGQIERRRNRQRVVALETAAKGHVRLGKAMLEWLEIK